MFGAPVALAGHNAHPACPISSVGTKRASFASAHWRRAKRAPLPQLAKSAAAGDTTGSQAEVIRGGASYGTMLAKVSASQSRGCPPRIFRESCEPHHQCIRFYTR